MGILRIENYFGVEAAVVGAVGRSVLDEQERGRPVPLPEGPAEATPTSL